MLACPGSAGFTCAVVIGVGLALIVVGLVVAPSSSSVSVVDCVVKLKDSTMLAGLRLLASAGVCRPRAAAIARCAPVSRQMPFSVASVMLGQVGPPASACLMAA